VVALSVEINAKKRKEKERKKEILKKEFKS